MIYNCPMCGEVLVQDIDMNCMKCGSEGVEERGNEFYCPACNELNPDEVRMVCRLCGSDEVSV
ncbi:MAG: hypothetical protein PHW53_03260 [Patescibacteria group bacterium]|nr:hypothetical protein [Patescibacteria group bacterium]